METLGQRRSFRLKWDKGRNRVQPGSRPSVCRSSGGAEVQHAAPAWSLMVFVRTSITVNTLFLDLIAVLFVFFCTYGFTFDPNIPLTSSESTERLRWFWVHSVHPRLYHCLWKPGVLWGDLDGHLVPAFCCGLMVVVPCSCPPPTPSLQRELFLQVTNQ